MNSEQLFYSYLHLEIASKESDAEILLLKNKVSEALALCEVINTLKTTLTIYKTIFSIGEDISLLLTTPHRGEMCNAEEQHRATECGHECKG